MIGVWATASRRKSRMWDANIGTYVAHGPWEQVSRLANPLFNEVIVPMAEKDQWNARPPSGDAQVHEVRQQAGARRAAAGALPGRLPEPGGVHKPRADLNAILMTGIPEGVVPGFQNFTGPVQADLLRLNVAIPPSASPNDLGLVAGDAAGFPNGRRVERRRGDDRAARGRPA